MDDERGSLGGRTAVAAAFGAAAALAAGVALTEAPTSGVQAPSGMTGQPSRARSSLPARAARSRAARPRPALPDVCGGSDLAARRGLAALMSLRPAAGSGYQLVFGPARRGLLGLTVPALRRIEVYVRPCDAESRPLLRHVIAHELGHAWDRGRLTVAMRDAWKRARGIPDATPWLGCSRCADFATPAGDFAEVYAQWRTGSTTNDSQLAGAPAPAVLTGLAKRFFGSS